MLNRIARRGSTLIEDAMETMGAGWLAVRDHLAGQASTATGREPWATTTPQETRPPGADGHMLPVPLTLEQRIVALEAENRRLWATVNTLLRRLR